MSAEIIQFVPRAQRERLTLQECTELKAMEFLAKAPALSIGEWGRRLAVMQPPSTFSTNPP